jgi:hypothetical protein
MREYLLELAAELRGMAIRIEAHAADPDGRAARACGKDRGSRIEDRGEKAERVYRSVRTGLEVGARNLEPTFTEEEGEEMRQRLPLGSGMWAQWADAVRDGWSGEDRGSGIEDRGGEEAGKTVSEAHCVVCGKWGVWPCAACAAAGGEDEVVKVVKGRIKLRSIATGEVVGVRLNPVGLAGDHEVWVS